MVVPARIATRKRGGRGARLGGESKWFYFHGNFRKLIIFVELSVTGRSIVVVRKAGGLVVRVRFSTPRQLLNSLELEFESDSAYPDNDDEKFPGG